ncbi:Aldo/keto reductase family protein [compost metagenome]
MHQPAVSTVIVGATRVEQVQQNLPSAALELDKQTLERLDQASRPFRSGEPFAFYRLP